MAVALDEFRELTNEKPALDAPMLSARIVNGVPYTPGRRDSAASSYAARPPGAVGGIVGRPEGHDLSASLVENLQRQLVGICKPHTSTREMQMALKEAIADVVETAKSFLSEDQPIAHPSTNAIELLKADHRRVEALFKQILQEHSLALVNQRANIEKVLVELSLHAKIEETIFYPAVYGKTKKDSDERLDVLEAFEEHGSMKDLMNKIKRATGRDESMKAKIQVLSEITEHHVKEEESEFFPEAEKLLGEKRLNELGLEIAKLKARSARSSKKLPLRKTAAVRKKSA